MATIRDTNIIDQVVITDSTGNAASVTGGKLDVNATVTPAAGGATEAKQDTQIAAEQAILAKIIAAPATEAKQTAANALLTTIDADTSKIPSQGSAAKAASTPVTIATDDTVIGATDAAVVAAGAVGSVSAKLRRISTDLNTIDADTDAIKTATEATAGSDLTFQTPVIVSQGSAGRATIMAGEEGKVNRLHEFLASANPGGTYFFAYDDDGAGTNEVALSGAYPVGTNGGIPIRFRAHPDGCIKTPAGKWLTVFSTDAKLFGHAIASKSTS